MENKIFTAVDLSATWNCHRVTVLRIARQLGLGNFIGNVRVFTQSEAEKINQVRRATPGQPKKKLRKTS